MSRISVGLAPELASAVLGSDVGPGSTLDLRLRQLRETGVSLVPQQANVVAARDLAADEIVWFSADVSDDTAAAELTRRLLDVEGVLSAYHVPPEGPP